MTSPPFFRAASSVAVPWPLPGPRPVIVPVFLPFFGCARRCLFCAQEAQTGERAIKAARLPALLAEARGRLSERVSRALPPAELAFYGGTFTATSPEALAACLEFAAGARARGLISSFRCSTRPDCVDAALLDRLAAAGCTTVELGVQSFADAVLSRAGRGYTGAEAMSGCAAVAASGLGLVVQLLPGMPGSTPAAFLADVREAVALGARALRLYPCLVLEGTGLAALWRGGAYEPWDMETTLAALARGWLFARKAGVTVLRMGVAPGEDLARALLAGPWHEALGTRVLGRALLLAVAELARGLEGRRVLSLEVPLFVQGHFWGHAGELRKDWARMGIGPEKVRFVPEPLLRLRFGEEGYAM